MQEVCFCGRSGDVRDRDPSWTMMAGGGSGALAVVIWTTSSGSARRPACCCGERPGIDASFRRSGDTSPPDPTADRKPGRCAM
jgi:hypothetical protein